MVTIHRDRTFEFNGDRFGITFGGPGWGYEVHALNEWWSGTDLENHQTLRELRVELQRRAETGQPIRVLLPGDTMDHEGRIWRDGQELANVVPPKEKK